MCTCTLIVIIPLSTPIIPTLFRNLPTTYYSGIIRPSLSLTSLGDRSSNGCLAWYPGATALHQHFHDAQVRKVTHHVFQTLRLDALVEDKTTKGVRWALLEDRKEKGGL